MAVDTKAVGSYTGEDIVINDGLVGIYERPGMYIGTTGKSGLHHLLWEVINNSVDEALAGYCDFIGVTLNSDNSITTIDNGRGIPVDDKKLADGSVIPTVQAVLTKVHSGGKFDSGAYKYSGGLHGVGITVVNALSEYTNVEVRRNGIAYALGFQFQEREEQRNGVTRMVPDPGVLVKPLTKIGKVKKDDTGTTITFKPIDNGKFETTNWDFDLIAERLKFFAHTCPNLAIELKDEREVAIDFDEEGNPNDESRYRYFLYENGIEDLVDERAENIAGYEEDGEIFFDVLLADGSLRVDGPILDKTKDDGTQDEIGEVEIVAQWTNETSASIDSIVNSIPTSDGGTHVKGVRSALVRVVNRMVGESNMTEEKSKVEWEDISRGIILVINAYLQNPEFSGQTKASLSGGSVVTQQFYNAANRALSQWAEDHPIEMRDIAQRAVENMEERIHRAEEGERAKRDTRGSEPSRTVSPKLRDCHVHDSNSELIVVEGNSAGSGTEEYRNPLYQALLPLRGKIYNLISKGLKYDENNNLVLPQGPISDIVNSLGCGTLAQYDEEKLRYGRLVIMTDADDDGRHITLLIMGTLYLLMPEFIYNGHLYEVRTPLYSGTYKDDVVFAGTQEEQRKIIQESKHEYAWTRFKGLGQMDKDELYYHGLSPRSRVLKRITVDRAHDALMELIMDSCLGSDSSPKWEILRYMEENEGKIPEWLLLDTDEIDEEEPEAVEV